MRRALRSLSLQLLLQIPDGPLHARQCCEEDAHDKAVREDLTAVHIPYEQGSHICCGWLASATQGWSGAAQASSCLRPASGQ